MKLTFKDVLSTIVAGAIVVALSAALLGYDWSLFATWRGAVGTVGALGVLMLIVDETDLEKINAWGALEWILVLAGAGLVAAGLITTSKLLFILAAADILAFWLASVARHALSHESVSPHGTLQAM